MLYHDLPGGVTLQFETGQPVKSSEDGGCEGDDTDETSSAFCPEEHFCVNNADDGTEFLRLSTDYRGSRKADHRRRRPTAAPGPAVGEEPGYYRHNEF